MVLRLTTWRPANNSMTQRETPAGLGSVAGGFAGFGGGAGGRDSGGRQAGEGGLIVDPILERGGGV